MSDEHPRGTSAAAAEADNIPGVKSREPDDGRVTRRMLAEGQIERLPVERGSQVQIGDGGLTFRNALELADAAKYMSAAGPLLPPWLQGNVGGCWAVLLRSQETGISPLALAGMMFVTEKRIDGQMVQRVAYDSTYFRTMVERFAPIKERLDARYEGEGDDLVCIVFATFKGEKEPRQFPPKGTEKDFTLKKLHPGHGSKVVNGETIKWVKGSPLWDEKPALQMFYAMSRDWSRMYCADIVSGAYTREELVAAGYSDKPVEITNARDMSPRLIDRLRGPVGEGFEHTKSSIEASITAATPVDRKRSGIAPPADAEQPAEGAAAAEIAPSS